MPSDDADKKKPSSSSKAKDLSHVPCKFFKVGGCTAGASCPFSHSAVEPGAQKETCTWFVKGNCKFGHKCALAHILPGQSMAMDRKNKKAAQAAAGGGGGGGGGGAGGEKKAGKKRDGHPGNNRLPLLAGGATAPTRMAGSATTGTGRPPMTMPLKATISPSAPAPPLKDTDFATFAAFDEPVDKTPATDDKESDALKALNAVPTSAPRPSGLSKSRTAATDFGPIGSPPTRQPVSPTTNGFSPGTSPRAGTSPSAGNILSAPEAPNHFSTHYTGGIAASLGSGLAMMGMGATHGRRAREYDDYVEGQPNSFGGLLNAAGRGEYDISIEYDEFTGVARRDTAVGDEDLEDFLPSSLNDLLTPQERSRRMSRSNSGQPTGNPPNTAAPAGFSHLTNAAPSTNTNTGVGIPNAGAANAAANLVGHRYSRSVPATSLLGDIKSIWSDPSAPPVPPIPSSPHHRGTPSQQYRFDPSSSAYLGAAGSSSTSAGLSGIGIGLGNGASDDLGLSVSLGSRGGGGTPSSVGVMSLSPTNASAAFLPGLHHHYKAKQAQLAAAQQQAALGMGGISRGMGVRGVSNPLFSNSGSGASGSGSGANATTSNATNPSIASNYISSSLTASSPLAGGLPSSLSNANASSGGAQTHTHTHGGQQTTYRMPHSPFDLTQFQNQQQQGKSPLLAQGQQQQQQARASGSTSAYGGGGYGGAGGYGQQQVPHTALPVPSGLQSSQQGYNTTSNQNQNQNQNQNININNPNHPTHAHPSQLHHGHGHGHPSDDPLLAPHLLSPSTRALQAHAPGQSLPQGLAAGYSRIHALPPLVGSLVASPPAGSGSGSGAAVNANTSATTGGAGGGGEEGPYGRPAWDNAYAGVGVGVNGSGSANANANANGGAQVVSPQPTVPPGMEHMSMLSRLSYSNAAGGGGGGTANPSSPSSTGPTGPPGQGGPRGGGPPGLSRNVSGGKYGHPHGHPHSIAGGHPGMGMGMGMGGGGLGQGPLSPLSGPAMSSRDDDDLFDMDR